MACKRRKFSIRVIILSVALTTSQVSLGKYAARSSLLVEAGR